MKHLTFLALALFSCTALAQERAARVISPEIHADQTVTFRLRAPQAQKVAVSGDWGSEGGAMTKDDAGIWSLTLGPLTPDIYTYSFNADGVTTVDPSNPRVKPMRSPTSSVLEMRGDPPAVWDRQPGIARGTVHLHDYASKALGRERRLRVYTPPGYDDAAKGTRFPVLYLLHGSGDNEATWTEHGRAHVILDNLIAAGQAPPMVVVMTDGHATVNFDAAVRPDPIRDFQRDLFEDVMPLVEARYRVGKEPAMRAIAGLSMGGNQAVSIGLNHLDTFAWVGGMSSAVREPERVLAPFLADTAAQSAKLQLFWLACGKEDRLLPENIALHELLAARGVAHEWHLTEGAHKWTVWRRHLAALAPRLFAAPPRAGQ